MGIMSEATQAIAWAYDDVMARQIFRYLEEREFAESPESKLAAQLYRDPPEATHFSGIERSDKAGQYRIGVDLAKGGDRYTVHSVRVK